MANRGETLLAESLIIHSLNEVVGFYLKKYGDDADTVREVIETLGYDVGCRLVTRCPKLPPNPSLSLVILTL